MEANTAAYELGLRVGALLASLIVGGFIAAFPLIIGIKRGEKGLGISGAVVCFLTAVSLGAIGALLSILFGIIFVVAIIIKSKENRS